MSAFEAEPTPQTTEGRYPLPIQLDPHIVAEYEWFAQSADEVLAASEQLMQPELLAMKLRAFFEEVDKSHIRESSPAHSEIAGMDSTTGVPVYFRFSNFKGVNLEEMSFRIGSLRPGQYNTYAEFGLWMRGDDSDHIYKADFLENGKPNDHGLILADRIQLFEMLADDFMANVWLDPVAATEGGEEI